MTINSEEIDDIEKFVKNELNCEYRYGYDIEFNGNNAHLIMDEQELIRFIMRKKGLFEHTQKVYNQTKITIPSKSIHKEFQCHAGTTCIACDPCGNIKACITDIPVANIYESYETIIKKINVRIQKSIPNNIECYDCKLKPLCEYCPAKKDYDKLQSCKKAKALTKLFEKS